MKKVLVTGGPVHAHLDAVKIITNRFRGGLMSELAGELSLRDLQVTYVCAGGLGIKKPEPSANLTVREHRGFNDYERLVLELSPDMDAVILGAAVANLIPVKPFAGKFPSHNYKPGDIIPIDFTIAPRIIDRVKAVAPKAHLFGFKLLSGVAHEELIRAAYEIVLASGATAVFANDTEDLNQKYAVTKERAVHPLRQKDLAGWIWQAIHESYYRTEFVSGMEIPETARRKISELIGQYADKFTAVENGMIFGTVAVRAGLGFVTTSRGKRELDSLAYVLGASREKRTVIVAGREKASLNAPLLAKIFENPAVAYIVHYHRQEPGLPEQPYAFPGTVRDSDRPSQTSFNIREHGCMLLFDQAGRRL